MDTKSIKLQIIQAGEKAVKELIDVAKEKIIKPDIDCLLYTSPSPRD